jgi:invasion protein IalB
VKAFIFMTRGAVVARAFAACAAVVLSLGAAHGESVVKAKTGAWDVRCDSSPGAPEQCALTQSVKAEDKAGVGLAIMILKPKDAGFGVMRVIAPLNVFLPNGVSLKVDQTDIGRTGFQRCFPEGCLAEVAMDEKIVEQLKHGNLATLVIYLSPYEGLRHQLNLQGLAEGYEKLR